MALSFNTIPVDVRTPGQFLEFDNSRALRGLPVQRYKVLMVGQKLAAGSAAAGVPVLVLTADAAAQLFGRGSMLHRMFIRLKAIDPLSETWAFPMADVGGGTAATWTYTVNTGPTAAGTLQLYIAGQRLQIALTANMTATQVAAAIVAAVNAATDLPCTAANAAGVVTFTCRWKGATGNYIDTRNNYYSTDVLPTGLTATIVAPTNGATNPDISSVFTTIGDMQFSSLIYPYVDTANIAAVETALAARWNEAKQIDGMGYTATVDTFSNMATLGTGRNSQFNCIAGVRAMPSPPWELAAAYGAQVGYNGSIDPARPFQTLELPGLLAPAIADRLTQTERDLLLHDGISTLKVAGGDMMVIERPITTWQTNSYGLPDVSYLDVNTMLTLSYIRYSVRNRIATKFPRHKLADDGTPFSQGQAMVTPQVIRLELIALARDWVAAGLVENLAQFKADLKVERDGSDKNRVNAIIPPDLVNQFRVFAGQVQFLL